MTHHSSFIEMEMDIQIWPLTFDRTLHSQRAFKSLWITSCFLKLIQIMSLFVLQSVNKSHLFYMSVKTYSICLWSNSGAEQDSKCSNIPELQLPLWYVCECLIRGTLLGHYNRCSNDQSQTWSQRWVVGSNKIDPHPTYLNTRQLRIIRFNINIH